MAKRPVTKTRAAQTTEQEHFVHALMMGLERELRLKGIDLVGYQLELCTDPLCNVEHQI